MKLKEIKGLLPEYNDKIIHHVGCCHEEGFKDCRDLLAEREIEVSVCPECYSELSQCAGYSRDSVGKCKHCTNGVIIKVKDGK